MKILVTGAGGYLAEGLVKELEERKHQIKLSDFRDIETKHEFVKCDLLDREGLLSATKGVDIIFHAAALGGTTGHQFAGAEALQDAVKLDYKYFDVNVVGTFNIFRTAQANCIDKVVLVSSEAATIPILTPTQNIDVFDENTPPQPDYLYGFTKFLDEAIGEFFAKRFGIRTISLRMAGYGGPKSLRAMGEGLLQQRAVLRRDMALAAIKAIEKFEKEEINYDAILLRNRTDFTKDDLLFLRVNPEKVMEKYYPGSVELMQKYDIPIPKVYSLSDISKAKSVLGWEPSFSFRDFIENLKAGNYIKDYMFKE